MRPKTLSKSRFKLAVECPTKVFYSLDRDRYVNAKDEDEFLQALADGGFQVGSRGASDEETECLVVRANARTLRCGLDRKRSRDSTA